MKRFTLLSLLLLFLVISPAWAQITIDNTSEDSDRGAVTSVSWSHTISSNTDGILLVICGFNGPGNTRVISTVDFNTVESASFVSSQGDGSPNRIELWRLLLPTVTTANIAVVFSDPVVPSCGAASYTDVDQTTPFGTPVGGIGNGTSTSRTVSGGDMAICVISKSDSTDTITVDTGQTERVNRVNGSATNREIGGLSEEAGAGHTGGWSWTSAEDFSDFCTPMNEAGAAPAPTPRRRMVVIQ